MCHRRMSAFEFSDAVSISDGGAKAKAKKGGSAALWNFNGSPPWPNPLCNSTVNIYTPDSATSDPDDKAHVASAQVPPGDIEPTHLY